MRARTGSPRPATSPKPSLSRSSGEQRCCGDRPVEGQPLMRLLVGIAERGGMVLTSDPNDLEALAADVAELLIVVGRIHRGGTDEAGR